MEGGWTEVAEDAPCLLPRPQVHPGNSAEANGYFPYLTAEDEQWSWGLLLETESIKSGTLPGGQRANMGCSTKALDSTPGVKCQGKKSLRSQQKLVKSISTSNSNSIPGCI